MKVSFSLNARPPAQGMFYLFTKNASHSTEIILQLFPQKSNIFSLPIFFDSILIVLVLPKSEVKVKSASEVKLLKWKSSVI